MFAFLAATAFFTLWCVVPPPVIVFYDSRMVPSFKGSSFNLRIDRSRTFHKHLLYVITRQRWRLHEQQILWKKTLGDQGEVGRPHTILLRKTRSLHERYLPLIHQIRLIAYKHDHNAGAGQRTCIFQPRTHVVVRFATAWMCEQNGIRIIIRPT